MKKILKKFAHLKKSSTFALGLSKEVLSPINLLVISFSVINYVVRVRVHAGCVDAHFFCIYVADNFLKMKQNSKGLVVISRPDLCLVS